MALHTQTPATRAASVCIATLAPSTELTHARLQEWIASALSGLARFRGRLIDKPFGIGQPVWAEIRDFNATGRIAKATLPTPGGDDELCVLIESLCAVEGSNRALWRAWTVDGLAGGRWALVLEMSPALADGGSGVVAVWDQLLSSLPDSLGPPPDEAHMGPAPSLRELFVDTFLELIENHIVGTRIVTELMTDAVMVARHQQPLVGLQLSTTPTNARLTRRRSVALTSIAAADVEAVSDAFGGKTTNVVLAACTLSLRGWLLQHGVIPVEPLVMAVPLTQPYGDSVRATTSRAVGRVHMPVHFDDPVEVLTYLHTATERLNIASRAEDGSHSGRERIADAMALMPPRVIRLAAHFNAALGLSWRGTPRLYGSLSFAQGPGGPAYSAGARVIGMHTIEPLAEGSGLGVVATSHDDVIDICLSSCPDVVADIDQVADGIRDAVAALVAAAHVSPRGEGQSVVSEMASHSSRRSI
ncbi:wax ester/triacylglycerol synthase domain-containing protein [Mycolicibacterium bacteremicum]|uniref:Uncharacterized protein n=2 Tax=Mycolicibacterium bacteremicum TaxID=564198 RepID=A0A1W9Z4T7_MYCBA|nr:wax ester/triacylglycerol synthase domain-containing protein [Mycolicibacterium bacteremicum]ORA07345.1 hypothetical protein BST17_01840 [Mycolicibacterium bacteremicum]